MSLFTAVADGGRVGRGAKDLPIMFVEVGVRDGDATVLDGVSIKIPAGAPTVLIGPNGSGKTTFLRAAMGLIAPSCGRITWGRARDVATDATRHSIAATGDAASQRCRECQLCSRRSRCPWG
jgi:ABC-type branched-subunit amino acid transport system ATPase component